MNAHTEVAGVRSPQMGVSSNSPFVIRVQARLHRQRLERELASGMDPNADPLRQAKARDLVGVESRRRIAASIERLMTEVDLPARPRSSKVPLARVAIRDSRWDLETIVERLKAPTNISPQGVAKVSQMLCDGAGPLYGNDPARSQSLHKALVAALDAMDSGPALIG